MPMVWEIIMLLCGLILVAWFTPAVFVEGRESLSFFGPFILIGVLLGSGGALGLSGVI